MNILVVDRSLVHRRGICNMLKLENFDEPIEASTDEEALTQLAKGSMDLVIISWMVGEENRLPLLTTIKYISKGKKLPVMVIIDRSFQDEIFSIMKSGADYVLLRPFTADQLRERVANAISGRTL
jgi:DNA-binding response OmpR family regulator